MSTKIARAQRDKGKQMEAKMAPDSPRAEPEKVVAIMSDDMIQLLSKSVSAALEDRLSKIQSTIEEIKEGLESQARRLTEVEQRLSDREDHDAQNDIKIAELQKENAELQDRVDDQENRNRRSNIRVIGLPESLKDKELVGFFEVWLPEALGVSSASSPIICERAHRLGEMNGGAKNRPRPVLAKILNWADKTKLMTAYRAKGSLEYDGNRLLMFNDFSTRVVAQRKALSPACKELQKHDIRFAVLYPAKLRIQHGGKIIFLSGNDQIQAFLNKLP